MLELKTYKDVIQALINGYEIEYQDMLTDTWKTVYKMSFDIYDLENNTRGEFRFKLSKPSIDWEQVSPNFKYLDINAYGSSTLYEREPIIRYDDWSSRGGSKGSANAFTSLSKGTSRRGMAGRKRPDNEEK